MARKRKDQEEQKIFSLNGGGLGYSQKGLDALIAGKYDQVTGRDPKYRTSSEQLQQSRELPVLEGIRIPTSTTEDFVSGFSRNRGVDTANARRKYEQRIGHFADDARNLRNRGYESSMNVMDFSDIGDWNRSVLDAALEQRETERKRQEKLRSADPNSPGAKLLNWVNSLSTPKEEDRLSSYQYFIDNYGKSENEVLDAYAQFKEAQERKQREEHPYSSGLKDFKSSPDRALANAVGNIAHFMFPDSDLDKMANSDTIQKKVKEVNKHRDYTYDSYKLSDAQKSLAKTINEGGDTLTNIGVSALTGTPFAVGDAAEGFGLVAELAPWINNLLTTGMAYGEAAGTTKHDLERQGIDDKKATEMAAFAGALSAGSRFATAKMAAKVSSDTILGKLFGQAKVGAKLGAGQQALREVADKVILGNEGTFDNDVQKYLAQGKSESEAGVRAFVDGLSRVGVSGVLGGVWGALSGLAQGGLESAGNKTQSGLNSTWAPMQDALPQNDIPLLTGTAENVPPVSGSTFNSVPALVDNIYPIQMSGTNGVIPMPGTNGVITLPDISSKVLPAAERIKYAAASVSRAPRLVAPIKGTAKKAAQAQISKNNSTIKANNGTIKQYKELAKTGKNKAERNKYAVAATELEKQNTALRKSNTDLKRQISGELPPIKELLPEEALREVENIKKEIRNVSTMYVSAENKAVANDAITALDNYIQSGDPRDYNDFVENIAALEKVATETYVNKNNPNRTSTYGTYHNVEDGSTLSQKVALLNEDDGMASDLAKNLIPAVRNLVKEQKSVALPQVTATTAPTPTPQKPTIQTELDKINDFMAKKVGKNDSIEMENGQVIEKYSMKEMKSVVKDIKENGLPEGFQLDIRYKDGSEAFYSSGDDTSNIKLTNIDSVVWRNDSTDAYAGNNVSIYPDDNAVENAYWRVGIGEAPKVASTSAPKQQNIDPALELASRYAQSYYDFDTYSYMDDSFEMESFINQMAEDIKNGEDLTSYIDALEDIVDDAPDENMKANIQNIIDELNSLQNGADKSSTSALTSNNFLTDDDLSDYMKSGQGFHKNRYEAYKNGAQVMVRSEEELRNALQNILDAPKDQLNKMQPIGITRVSKSIADQLNTKDSDVHANNYFFQLEPQDLWHAFRGHEEATGEDNLPMSFDDMVYAISHLNDARVLDVVKESGGRKLARLIIPETDSNEYYTAQVISKGDGALSLKTLVKIKKGSMDSIGDSKNHNAIRSHTTSNNNIPSETPNVKAETPDKGYWNRILGDDTFLAEEAQKQGVEPNELRKWAAKNLGYGDDNINPPSSGNVPPEPPKGGNGGGGNQRERGMSKHMRGEGKMDVDIPEEVKDDFINDPDMYEALSNKTTKDKALKIYNEHPDDREAIFRNMLTQYDPAALPLGQMIAKDYSAQGNHAMAAQIFRDMGERLTKAGQFSQASILTMLKNDPLTAQEYAQRSIDKLNKQGKKEFGKNWKDLNLTQEEIDAFNNIEPGDEKALAELYDKIGQRLGREYPSTMMEKLLEGRKVAMLFNVRTISRNFFANPPTLGMRWMADRVEALGQAAVNLIDPTFEKTQSIRSGGTGRKLAKEFTKTERYQKLVHGVDEKHTVPDLKSEIIHHKQMYKGTAAEKFIDKWSGNAFNSISDALYEAGKIKSNPHIEGGIQALNKKAFNKDEVQSILETIRNTTYKLLDVTDSPFVKENFVERLGSYLNAQEIKNLDEIPEDAIQLAWNEALKATYKDDSWMVKALSKIRGGVEQIPGIGKPLSQGLIPFLQAPGNIAARMVDYSPINFTKGVAQIIKGATKKDHNTIRKGIEAAAKGLTGSALALLGMKLYKSGILTGDYSQDNKEKSFQQRNGFKPWSLHVDGKYFTFNWMQPFAQTIMAGILAQQAIDNADDFDSDVLRHFGIEGSTAGKVIGAAYQSGKAAVNSWFDESPLGDLTKLFSGNYFDRDIAQNMVDVGEDFAGAMYPATGNALAKTVDTTKRNTKDPSNRFSTFLNEQMAKVPFVSENLPASYDTWGEEIKNANSRAEAFFQRFAYPGEYSSDSSDPLDVEVQRLFKSTNDNRAFPFYAANKVGDKTLNNKEKSEYQKDMGQRSKKLAQAFVDSDQYKSMDDANRVETLNSLYYTSKAITERDVFGKPVADSSPYKKFIQAYDEAGGGEKGVKAIVDMTQAKSSMKAANVSASSNLGKEIEKAAKAGDEKKVEEMTKAAQSVEDLGFTKVGPKETYIKAKSVDSSLSLEDFGKTYKDIDVNGNEGITQKEMINYLNENKVPEVKGLKMWDMYAPNGKKVPYIKKDGSWGTH